MISKFCKFQIILLLLITLGSCYKGRVYEEPAGSAEYIINNQTNGELSLNFITSEELGLKLVDTISNIEVGNSRVIFTDGIIGVNPQPSDSFSKLEFMPSDNVDKKYLIEVIDNELWNIIDFNFDESGYGLTIYELVVSEEDFE